MILVIFDDTKVTPKYCNKGCRAFCARYGFDWSDFKTNGVDADLLLSTGDAMALELVERAKRRLAGDTNE